MKNYFIIKKEQIVKQNELIFNVYNLKNQIKPEKSYSLIELLCKDLRRYSEQFSSLSLEDKNILWESLDKDIKEGYEKKFKRFELVFKYQ